MKAKKNTRLNKPVWYEQDGKISKGNLSLIVHSTVHPQYDLAYIDFKNHWKIALLSEIKYIKKTNPD